LENPPGGAPPVFSLGGLLGAYQVEKNFT